MKRVRWIPSIVLLLLVGSSAALAQRTTVDPRTRTEPLTVKHPAWGVQPGTLQGRGQFPLHGRVVGYATMERSTSAPINVKFDENNRTPQTALPTFPPLVRLERRPNGTVSWMRGSFDYLASYEAAAPPAGPTLSGLAASRATGAIGFMEIFSRSIGLNDPATEMAFVATATDELGYGHTRFKQVYNGLEVWGRDVIVHSDAAGKVYLMNGSYEKTPTGLDVTFTVTPDQAYGIVVDRLRREGRMAPVDPSVELLLDMQTSIRSVIYPDPVRGMRVAYEVEIHPNLVEHFTFLVDANDGSLLNRIADHCSLIATDRVPHVPAVSGLATVEAKGTDRALAATFESATASDLNGQSRSIRTWHGDDGKYYFVWDLPNLNAGKSSLPDKPEGGCVTYSLDNKDLTSTSQLNHITSSNNSWSDPSSVSAHYNMKVAYDYYSNVHGRKAIDDKDASIISIIHGTEDGQPMENAYWTGRFMVYGDGATIFKPLAGGLDVAGHEMSHGVIGSTAGLIYQDQSGALNESFADVFGTMIDRDDWFMGEDIMQPGKGVALRDLSNPANTQLLSPQPAHMNDFKNTTSDNGGVHINSGIPNKACYNVAESLGRDKTEKIYYRALTNYLNRNSNFVDCRKACEQAATDLYGASDAQAVGNAFGAVGIGPTGGSDPGGDDVPPVTGGRQYIAFVSGVGEVGVLDVLTDQYVIFNDPNAVARVNQNLDDRAQVSAPLLGNAIYFVNKDGKLVSVRTADGQVTVYDVSIQSPGDLWNAAISPDENYAAVVSAYENDATMYITDGQQMGQIPLKVESSQDGIEDRSIKYPDAVSWSRNWKEPRIAFDALNGVPVGGSEYTYWAVYEIDFAATTIYNLVPAQSTDLSLGNITYSNTDPDLVAFNVVYPNAWDIVVGRLTGSGFSELDIPSKNPGGLTILDAARPTFSPDDNLLAFTSASNNALLVMQGSSGQIAGSQFPAPIYNPFWFVVGGSVPGLGVGIDAATDGSITVRPNPTVGTGTITWDVERPGRVSVDLIDLTGTQVRSIFDGNSEAGHFEQALDTRDLANGVYLIKMQAGDALRYLRLVVAR